MKKKQILVCGTGFGKIYLKAIAESKEYELMGILGKGSDRSRLLSKNLNVPMYTDIKEINQNVDAACVVVPNAAGGGNGANIAKSILAKGIPTLLEHPAHEVEIVNCIRESGSAAFMLNPFYRYIKPIRDFLEAAQIISKHAHLINASLECAIHVLYDGIDILGCALGGLSTWKLGNVAESYTTSMAGGGNRVISGIIGMVPVTFIVNTNVDRNDIDHPLHLYHRIELLEPKFLVAPVGSRISVATQGRLRYETYITDIKQVGMDQWTWRLTYKVFCGKNIVSTVDSLMSWNYQSVEKILNQLTKMHFRTAKLSETLLLAIKAR